MADRIIVQVQFKKFLWTCPSCGQEDVEDRPMEGGAEYVHVCSKCSAKFNQSGSNAREYNGSVSYSKDEYDKVKKEDVDKAKKDKMDAWITEIKNPPVYVEPTKKELEAQKASLEKEITELTAKIEAKR